MSKEIQHIVAAYEEACRNHKKTALATVVHVEGSSYRRPGARMLVEDDGKITGAISGGCLEGDALRRALKAIHGNEKRLVTYDTTREDDIEFGVQLGCNGIVHILFEPVDASQQQNPVLLLKNCANRRAGSALITLFNLSNPLDQRVGTSMFLHDPHHFTGHIPDAYLQQELLDTASEVFKKRSSEKRHFSEQSITALVEYVKPPVSLVLIGAGNDALPVVELAALLGWKVTVADGRSSHANLKRFPHVHQILTGKPRQIIQELPIDENTALILMTHNFNYDLDFIQELNAFSPGYIGCLGPKKRLERIFHELEEKGVELNNSLIEKMHGPAGLDIGAEVSEEIALSILAEIKTVFERRDGSFLKNRLTPIHESTEKQALK